MKDYTKFFCGAWGFLMIDKKNVFSNPLPCKKKLQ